MALLLSCDPYTFEKSFLFLVFKRWVAYVLTDLLFFFYGFYELGILTLLPLRF